MTYMTYPRASTPHALVNVSVLTIRMLIVSVLIIRMPIVSVLFVSVLIVSVLTIRMLIVSVRMEGGGRAGAGRSQLWRCYKQFFILANSTTYSYML